MTTMPLHADDLIDPSEFEDLPRSETEFRRRVWGKLLKIEKQTTITNGRVSELERFRWVAVGALGVLSLIVVPIFISLVAS